MVLLELAVQGVRGCSASARVSLKAGYTLVKAPQAPVPPLASLLAAILYPDARGSDGSFLAAGMKTGRAGVSLQGEGGATFRLVRELGGSGALHKLNPTSKAFEVVTTDANEIVTTLRAAAAMPTRTSFEQLYTLTAGQLPSHRPRKSAARAPRLESISGSRELERLSDEEVKEYQARIPVLEKELADAKVLAELQFKQDGLQSELYNAETKLRAYDEAREKVNTGRAEFEAAPTAEKLGMPKDIIEQLKRHEAEIKKRNDALRKIQDERDGTHVLDTGPARVDPIWKDNNFNIAMAAGAALTIGGTFLEGPAKYVAMAALAPWAFAAVRALVYVESFQAAARQSGRFEIHSQREKKLMDERALAQAQINAAFTAVQVDSMEDFVTAMGKRAAVQQALGEAEIALAEMDVDPEYTGLADKVAGLRADLEKIQEQFHGSAGGYFRGPLEVEKELNRAKELLRRTKGGAAPAASAAVADSGSGSLEDPGPALLAAAAEVLQADVTRAAAEYKDRTSQYLAALSDKKWQGADIGADGRGTVVAPNGQRTPVEELQPRDADLYYLSLRLAVVEKLGPKVKMPLVIEDCFADAVDAARFPLLNRMLKHLGSVAQVLHVSGAGQNAFQADALVTV